MRDFVAKTALGGIEPRKDVIGSLTLQERDDIALASISARLGQEEALKARLETVCSVVAPKPGRSEQGENRSLHWLGADQYLCEEALSGPLVLARRLVDELAGVASVTDQTDAFVRMDVSGQGVVDLLQRLTVLDVEQMLAGAFSRTAIHHVGCLLRCNEAGMAFSVYAPRSYAISVHHALVEVSKAL
ncbi:MULTISPECIES: sarcosine oxidase subunit gamma [unclassified Ruegeria]|uniref:sarcosine oxidase subunit gamma n=1 Tax=unclassified Ruegeria TaxID=2625375 RepID=UPI00148964DC|nr:MULTISPECIES: sarcosine oxidase subunit gamma [unclassified Ruegeria]NOD36181.1 sarcosine oxidase subunit gamma [Ruegeria sp. HKCCD7296]NOD47412.1 sarcosine oxidase subunit gamma [Ruegeria sp. HKCCD5849]NOD53195.1 sarcosine oxidase subunit gamma [Ruegeria sp. HKCCD5851]NOD66388.1 sarcosine oxidase subunit gamma [Ruegeria sp. HKCCD7303]NOE34123.1 sarcosine oxidase subunit gamma [Ruegeria sp. HKCCD7318]